MSKRKPAPIITHTELLCLAYRTLEKDVGHWRTTLDGLPDAEERVAGICARQLAQMDAIRTMYRYETGVDM